MTDPLRILAFRVMDPGVNPHCFHKVQTPEHEVPLTLDGGDLGHGDLNLKVTAERVQIEVQAHGDRQVMGPKGGLGMCRTIHPIRDAAGNILELKPGPAIVHYDTLKGGLALLLRHTHGIVGLVVYRGALGHPHTTQHLWELNRFISQTYGQDALTGGEPLFPLRLMKALQDAVYECGRGFGDEPEDTFDQ